MSKAKVRTKKDKAVGIFVRVGPEVRRAICVGAARRDMKPAELVRAMIHGEVERLGLMKKAGGVIPIEAVTLTP